MGNQEGDIEQRCAAVVDQLLAQYGWRLLERDEFVHRTCTMLAEQDTTERYAAYGVYNQCLYRACSGAEGAERREHAFGELRQVLYRQALKSYPDVYEDATQLALAEVLMRFAACHEPRAFIPFALKYLMGAARTLRRREGRTVSLERKVGDDDLSLGDTIADESNIEETAAAHEERLTLHRFLARYMDQHPRARKQIDAVRLKYIYGYDDEAISRLLGVSVPGVHVLRSRGLSRLRSDPGWQQTWNLEA